MSKYTIGSKVVKADSERHGTIIEVPEDQREASTKEVLQSLGLIDDDGLLKNATILLFGKNPLKFFPSVAFKIGRFGKDEADLMFKAGFIDTWGRGYKKIRDGFEAAGIPMPRVQNFCGGVQVTVQRTKFMQMMNVGNNVGNMSRTQLTDRQIKICKLIKDYPHISAKGLSEVLSVVPRTIERDLSELQKEGVIIREGSKTAGHWVILKQIKD